MKTKPHVLHVVHSLEVGGLERLVHDLAIARGGEATSVACIDKLGSFGEALRKKGVPVTLIGKSGGFFRTASRTWRHVRRAQPDLIHCHNFPGFVYGALAARLAGNIPVVMTKHGASEPMAGPIGQLNRYLVRGTDVVGISRETVELMEAWMGSGRRGRYIPNGICLDFYKNLPAREAARARLGLPGASFVVGIVARVAPGKGHLLLLDVFARVLQKIPDALLLVVGGGTELPAVQAHLQKRRLEKSVLTMGERQDVPTILAALDVFCLPSETEGMPMTVLEAMAVGLPVVASNVGGIPELVEEGRTGLLVPPRAPDQLEAALLALAKDPERACRMGKAGRERLRKEFSLERMLSAYEELYLEATGRGEFEDWKSSNTR